MMREFLQKCPFAMSLDRKEYDQFFQSGTSRADFLLFDKAVVCEVKEIQSLDIEKQVKNLARRGKMQTDVFNRYFCNSIIKALRKANDQVTDTKQALSCAGALGLIVLENCIPAKMSGLTLASVANQTMNTELAAINGALCLDFVNYFENKDDGDRVRPSHLLLRPTEESRRLSGMVEVMVRAFCEYEGIPFRDGFKLDAADQLWHAGPRGDYDRYTANITFELN
jgi:hypothetical protein